MRSIGGLCETDELCAALESQHFGRVIKSCRHHPRHLSIFGKAVPALSRASMSGALDLLSNFGTTKYDLGQQIRPIAVETHGALNATS